MRLVLKDATALDEITKAAASKGTKRLMGEHLLSQASAAFQDQKRGPVQWPERHVPNIAGILQDLNQGPSIKSRRFDPRPAGVDTGRLGRMSLASNYQETAQGFEVYTEVPYAPDFQAGGKRAIQITDAALKNLAVVIKKARGTVSAKRKTISGSLQDPAFFKKAQKATQAGYVAGLGWIFDYAKKSRTITITVPPRPFLTIEADDADAMAQIATDAVAAAKQP